jgi:uncharacterized RmlC-like cupin family protein
LTVSKSRSGKKVTVAEIEKRVARYSDVMKRGSFGGAVDSHIPEHRKKICAAMGHNVTSGQSASQILDAEGGFSVNFMTCAPGNYPHLHSHDTLEVFVPVSGRWRFLFGDDGEAAIEVGPFDVVSCPVGMMRTLINIADDWSVVLVIIGLDEKGRAGLEYPEEFLAQLTADGVEVDDRGILVKGPPVSELA